MTCDEVREQLPALQDGDLPAATAAALQQHLDTCEGCAEELVLLDTTWDMLDAFPTVEVASDFNHRFWKRVESEPVTWWSRVREALVAFSRAPMRAVAVFAVVMLLVAGLGQGFWTTPRPDNTVKVEHLMPQEEDTAHYNVLPDVGDLVPDEDETVATPQAAPTADTRVDQLLEEMPLDNAGPQG